MMRVMVSVRYWELCDKLFMKPKAVFGTGPRVNILWVWPLTPRDRSQTWTHGVPHRIYCTRHRNAVGKACSNIWQTKYIIMKYNPEIISDTTASLASPSSVDTDMLSSLGVRMQEFPDPLADWEELEPGLQARRDGQPDGAPSVTVR